MANSFVRYTGNGSTAAYAIPFSYRSADDLSATVNGVNVTAYTLDAAGTTLTFDTAPADQSAIEIRRTTSQSTKLVDYVSGSVLTENDLDTDSDQAFYMSQEAIDKAGDVITLDGADFQWDVQNKRLKNVAAPTADTDAVNKAFISTNLPNITTVAGISSDVTTVAGISSDVETVADNDTNITTVADNISSVNTVATNISDVIKVADDLNEAISEVETVANDLNEATSEIETVANNIDNVNTVGTNIANVNTVAGNDTNITAVANNNTNINTVAGISSNVTTVAGISSDVTAVAGDEADIGTVATDIANVNTVAGSIANVNTVSTNIANVNSVAGNATNINTVAGNTTNINTVAANDANITTVAGANANISAVATDIANVNTVATNIVDVNSFANTYSIGASDPVSADEGDLFYNSTDNAIKYYNGSAWQQITADTDVKTLVSANDTTAGFLNGKLVAGSNVTFTENNDGGNETLSISATDNSIPFAIALG